jgi:hypothetical protein
MNELLPVITLVLGALLGLLTSVFTSAIQHRRTVVLKLLEQFLEVRKEVVNAISPFTNLDLKSNMTTESRIKHRDTVAELYYRHFDFLPLPVLDSMVRLQTCLDDPSKGPYAKQDNAIVSMSDADLPGFVQECSLIANSWYHAPLALKSKNPMVRENQAMKLHARHVLYTMNKYASIDDLLKMVGSLRKRV